MASKLIQAFRTFSPALRKKQIGSVTQAYRLRVCGPEGIIQSLKNTFEAKFKTQAGSLETMNMGKIQGFTAGWYRLSASCNDAFILVFYMDDEDSFQAISAFRDVIIAAKADDLDIPVLVVGYSQSLDGPRTIGPETFERLVTLEWGHGYTVASGQGPSDLEHVMREIFRIICDKYRVKAETEQKTTTL